MEHLFPFIFDALFSEEPNCVRHLILIFSFLALLCNMFPPFIVDDIKDYHNPKNLSYLKVYTIFYIKIAKCFISITLATFVGTLFIGVCVNWNLFYAAFVYFQIWSFIWFWIFCPPIVIGSGYITFKLSNGIVQKINKSIESFTNKLEKLVTDW